MRSFIIPALVILPHLCGGQITINEVMASNVRSFPNAQDFEDYPDWIELHNSSAEDISLFGYFLSDDPAEPRKWAFSRDAKITTGEHLLVVADGHNTAKGISMSRGYVGGVGFTTQNHHTNFKLSSAGEDLVLSREPLEYETVVPLTTTWKYYDQESSPDSTWNTPEFDDTTWQQDEAPFEYNAPFYDELTTEVSYGDLKEDKHTTTYFRKRFTVPAGHSAHSVWMNFQANDGAIFYLNGEEITRNNLPAGPVTSETFANEELMPFADSHVENLHIPDEKFLEGENVFAVELHQATSASDDLYLDFSFYMTTWDPVNAIGENIGTSYTGKEWAYLDDGSSPPAAWNTLNFDDSGWSTGDSPLGYFSRETSSDPDATQISYGGDPGNKTTNSYFRKQFFVDQLEDVRILQLTFQVDDGAYFYLNGQLILAHNTNPVTEVGGEGAALSYQSILLPSDALLEGINTLAVSVVQAKPWTPAMRFHASLKIAHASDLTTTDQLSFGNQVDDISLGRDSANPTSWVFHATPTPGAANAGPIVTNIRQVSPAAEVSPSAGLYEIGPMVVMNTSFGKIRYTTDGSNPTHESENYTGPFEIIETTIIRARVYELGKVPGEIVTRTYFVGEDFTNGLPYLSLVAPPDTLFGPEIGIYGNRDERGGNIHKGIDAPGHLEFFPPDGSAGFAVNGGFRLGGENNFLAHAQKAFNFATRGKYGDDALQYDLFPGSGVGTFTALTLREGGDDWGKAHLTDAIFDPIVKGRMEAETNRYRPAALFVNGEYWGLYNIRDRWDDNWFFQEYGTNDGEYDHIRAGETEAENGSIEDWSELRFFMANNPLDSPENWEIIKSKIDIDSLIDFAICETWGRNSSWRGNREWWKDHRPGSKWRWFLPDMDRTFGSTVDRSNIRDLLIQETTLSNFRRVPQFTDRFVQRAAAHLVDTLSEIRVNNLIDTLGSAAAPEIPNQFSRWGTPSLNIYTSALIRMKDFVSARDSSYLNEVRNQFSYSEAIELALSTSGEGSFIFAGVAIDAQTFQIIPNVETEIEAIPAPGYRFDHWTGAEGGATTLVAFAEASILTAHFVPDSSTELSGELSANTTLTLVNSPYIITSDLIVPAGVTLNIEEGVALEFASKVNLRVIGTLVVNGTEAAEVSFTGRHGATWGGVSFEAPITQSTLAHLIVREASRGYNPTSYPAAISGFNADLVMDFIDIDESLAPLFFRGGAMILRDSEISIPLTGDGLNVKQGMAQTIRCTFSGNDSPDTDAIDYDGVVDGLIKDCRIYDFSGFNSDGIDIGEKCVNCLLEGNVIYYNSDKGISVGQGSSITVRRNLIVGCPLGIAIKDEGSTAVIDQTTLVDCGEGVSVYEKNFGSGGGDAVVTNSIFSGCNEPTTVDQYSTLTVSYSISDTLALSGPGNLLADPMFADARTLNFEIIAGSPAIDSGDPQHETDPDGSRADMGARYTFTRDDYPFDLSPTIVINEVLANSGEAVDWIELHNRTADTIDVGGWFLSDGKSNLKKYRIPAGTMIGAGGFVTFSEDLHFGKESADPGKLEGFALSDTGETVYLSSAVGDQLTYYRFQEDFGPSLEGKTIGFHYKISSDSYNFVTMSAATPNEPNASPLVGPIVISEIMYDSDVEYLELLNLSSESVSLFDSGWGWRIDQGINYTFTSGDINLLTSGERLILTEDLAAFTVKYQPAEGTKILQWTSGKLNNGGETVQLDRPGPLSDLGTRTYVRVDRVKYDDDLPWDVNASGTGWALAKITESEYGNDFANWRAAQPTPLTTDPFGNYAEWAAYWSIDNPEGDRDSDGISNLFEYAFGLNPSVHDNSPLLTVEPVGNLSQVSFPLDSRRADLEIILDGSSDLETWEAVPTTANDGAQRAIFPKEQVGFFRLRILRFE